MLQWEREHGLFPSNLLTGFLPNFPLFLETYFQYNVFRVYLFEHKNFLLTSDQDTVIKTRQREQLEAINTLWVKSVVTRCYRCYNPAFRGSEM